jgi:hypothetical protein
MFGAMDLVAVVRLVSVGLEVTERSEPDELSDGYCCGWQMGAGFSSRSERTAMGRG